MSRLRIFILCLLLWAPIQLSSSAIVYAQADKILSPDVCSEAPDSQVCKDFKAQGTNDPVSGPNGVISKATNIIASFAGVVAVIVVIISGIMYITAGGAAAGQRSGDNAGRAKKAQQTLIGAVIGLIVIIFAWTIVRFVIDRIA